MSGTRYKPYGLSRAFKRQLLAATAIAPLPPRCKRCDVPAVTSTSTTSAAKQAAKGYWCPECSMPVRV